MARKRGGLGRGLSALFPDEPAEEMTREDATEKKEGASSISDTETKQQDPSDAELNKPLDSRTTKSSTGTRDIAQEDRERNFQDASVQTDVSQIRSNQPDSSYAGDQVQTLRVSRIEPDPTQPRKTFTEEELDQLAESIQEHGLLQPILVTPEKGTSRYLIVAGERRWRACQKAGIPTIQAIVRTFDSKQDQLEASLIENIQREDLNPIEEAAAFQRLIREFNLTQEEVAQKVSKSRTAVTNSLRLLKLDPQVQEMVIHGDLSMGHARALIPVEDKDLQKSLAHEIVEKNLSVREVEKAIRNLGKQKKNVSRETDPSLAAVYQDIQNRMQQSLGMNVKVSYKDNRSGKVEIYFSGDDDLEKLMGMVSQG